MVYWNKDAIYALSSYKVLAWPIGVWPIENDIFYSKIRYFFAIASEIWLMTTLLMNVYLACDNSSADPIDTYVVTSSAMLGIVKLTLLQIQRSTLSTSLYSAIQDWCSVKDARSREIMIQYARTARIISLSLFYSGFIALIFYMLRLLPFAHATTNGRTFVLPMSCLFESVSNLQYVLITFYQVIQLLITYAGNCCTEGMFVGVTMHLCGQLELLMIDFQQIDRKHKRKGGSIFEEFVIRHRELLKLTENIDDSYSIIILTQIFTSAILICITGFGLIVSWHIHDMVMIMKSIVIMIVMLLQCFLYSYAGDNLRDQSEALSFALYDSNWYDFSPNDIRDLTFIMIKTNIPIRLTAGKFFYVTRATFTDILRTAVSYLSALRVMIENYSHYLSPMASERWKDDIAYAITPFKLVAWSIGVWPLQVHNVFSLIPYTLGICCAIFMFIVPSIEFYLGCTDAETNVDCLMLICCGILGMLKTVWFRIYARNLANNYSSVMKDYLTIENTMERAIMRKHTFMGRIICCLILGFAYFSCVMYGLIAILDENKHVNITNEGTMLEYPIPSKCVMKYLNAPVSIHKVFCFIDTIALVLASTANHGNDALFLNVTLHVCGQVRILKANFLDFDVKSPHIYDRFNVLVERHKYLIKLARELAEMISFVLLIELFIISILLCIMGFQLILQLGKNNIVLIVKNIMVQSTFLTQLTLYGVIGNYLKSEMEEIGLSIYQSTWYNFPAKLTRHLIFIIMRSESPVTLQAGNFIVINLATYVSILKASLSYLSVLRVMVKV
ncbi:uncharacterized protein [Temnothorax longispinosus]|uniref:uncharacterized protein n=1 Tax=Temnothorax longispinosus TaxID=300112 RepID=UPI003A991B60